MYLLILITFSQSKGEPNSYVYGSILDNIFSGAIQLNRKYSDSFQVELAAHYSKDLALLNDTGHSIVYHTDNVNPSAYR